MLNGNQPKYNNLMLARKLTTFFLDILEVVVFAIAIFLFTYLLVMQPHKIKGDSMQPNFPDGEYLLTDKITYKVRKPQRGEVIVFIAPGTDDEEFIKRIIGLPGEKVKVEGGRVYLNGKILDESYLSRSVITSSGSFLKEGQEILVSDDNYLVFGDSRSASSDSRIWGYVNLKKITGKAWLIYWPPQSASLVEKVIYSFNYGSAH